MAVLPTRRKSFVTVAFAVWWRLWGLRAKLSQSVLWNRDFEIKPKDVPNSWSNNHIIPPKPGPNDRTIYCRERVHWFNSRKGSPTSCPTTTNWGAIWIASFASARQLDSTGIYVGFKRSHRLLQWIQVHQQDVLWLKEEKELLYRTRGLPNKIVYVDDVKSTCLILVIESRRKIHTGKYRHMYGRRKFFGTVFSLMIDVATPLKRHGIHQAYGWILSRNRIR